LMCWAARMADSVCTLPPDASIATTVAILSCSSLLVARQS
jgi:hypothetical protein